MALKKKQKTTWATSKTWGWRQYNFTSGHPIAIIYSWTYLRLHPNSLWSSKSGKTWALSSSRRFQTVDFLHSSTADVMAWRSARYFFVLSHAVFDLPLLWFNLLRHSWLFSLRIWGGLISKKIYPKLCLMLIKPRYLGHRVREVVRLIGSKQMHLWLCGCISCMFSKDRCDSCSVYKAVKSEHHAVPGFQNIISQSCDSFIQAED